ncbi:MAG: WG repeat-containing protein, partial [Thermoleophilia bacterium]|nr:WG repeat-containing protein [Thermoleophilia bacterium]
MSDDRRLHEADDPQLEDRLRRLSWPVERGAGWAGIQARAREEEGAPSEQPPATAPRASAPKARSRLRVAVYASLGVVLVAAVAVGVVMAAEYLGDDRSVLVIDDGALEPAFTGDASQPATTTSALGTGYEPPELYPVSVDGKWGFIDNTGTIQIEPQFDDVRVPWLSYRPEVFSEGLTPAAIGRGNDARWGYIDKTGAWVIEPRFGHVGGFSEGMASVNEPGDSKPVGYIDTSGTLVIPTQYVEARDFSEGLARVTDAAENSPGYFIDKTGAKVLGPFFGLPFGFSEGLAYVEWEDGRGFIDSAGERVITLPDGFGYGQHSNCSFSEGLALLQSWGVGTERSVFIDRTGAEIITSDSTYFQGFSEGLAVAEIQHDDGFRCGYVDKTGAWVIEPQFDWAASFSEGLAAVGYFEDDFPSYGYIDETGRVVIPPRKCAG